MIDQKSYDRFMAKVYPEPNSGCWLWTGGVTKRGYPCFFYEGKSDRAHVFSYIWHSGPVPNGRIVHHRCNVQCCVNPQHLEAVTYSKNSIDAWRRRRGLNSVLPIMESCREPLTQANHVIEKFGGMHALANALGFPVTTVQTWKKFGSIKERYWQPILKAADENGVDVGPLDFVAHMPA